VLTTCQPSTVWCSRERLPAAAAQPAQGSSEPVAPRIYFFCPTYVNQKLEKSKDMQLTQSSWNARSTSRTSKSGIRPESEPVQSSSHCYINPTCLAMQRLTFLDRFWEIPDSNFTPEASCINSNFCWFARLYLSSLTRLHSYCLSYPPKIVIHGLINMCFFIAIKSS
jgi:hypothetical protein